ncbi:hypothetical protein WJX74_003238 [Apatococcus lobatus]|uniref:Uncharacterized protein n=1 Tax=Apatococcus lobatus TaxID=904363 RepID=A0AAW1QK86_9CHLO
MPKLLWVILSTTACMSPSTLASCRAQTLGQLRAYTGPTGGTERPAASLTSEEMRSNQHAGRTYHGSPALLKSALQKCIRRGLHEEAVRIALHLLKENQTEFLRRICVICLEDAVLHPELPLLTWLMLASGKGFALTTAHAQACLTIVSDLAALPFKDHLRQAPAGDVAEDRTGR